MRRPPRLCRTWDALHAGDDADPESAFRMSFCLLSQASQQQTNQRHFDERFAGLQLALIVFAHPAVPREPAKRAFDNPPLR